MSHGSQTIQQQGRIVQVGEETGISKGEHGQSEGCKMAKKPCKHCGSHKRVGKWKQCPCWRGTKKTKKPKDQCTCRHCSTKFPPRYGEKNEYCSPQCHDEFRIMKWLPCSICMAKAGIGAQTAGKLLRIADSSIRRQWKRRGIKRDQRAGIKVGMLRVKVERGCAPDDVAQREALKHYEKASMEDIRSHHKQIDWSYIWTKEISRIKSNEKYQSLTFKERRDLGRRQAQRRCPIKTRNRLREWKRKARTKNPAYRIIENFRTRLWMVAKGRETRTMDLVGCGLTDFRSHIERNFKQGMTWDNYGTHWHVDHTLPVSSFDHNDPKQLKQCWHWTNLKPMTANKNLRKGARITEPQMELLLCAH